MNIIHQKRENIIKDNNTAQEKFESLLTSLKSAKPSELNVSFPLQGDLDLSILEKLHDNINSLIFVEGEITSIRNIPKHINKLVIAKNLLVELDDLPSYLVYLDVANNYLKNIDISNSKNLEILHCQENKIKELIYSSNKNLTELYIHGNDLEWIDLQDWPELLYLNISNNPLIIVENNELASNLREFKSNNTPLANLSTKPIYEEKELKEEALKRVDYITALNTFFKMKRDYEQANLTEKRKISEKNISKNEKKDLIRKFKPKCIKCKKDCGTIFSNKGGRYSAICGSTSNPCKLNIKLYKGEFVNIEMFLEVMKDFVNQHKQDIIKQKLDTLLNYISEEDSSSLFKEKIEAYNDDNVLYMETLAKYNEVFNNEERKDSISKKKKLINKVKIDMQILLNKYKETDNTEFLKTAVETYCDTLHPEMQNLTKLKYHISEVDKPENNNVLNILHQFEVEEAKKYMTLGEVPQVENFVV